MAGDAGAPADGGAAGATQVEGGDACDPCDEGWELAACSEGPLAQCVCEPENTMLEDAFNDLLACNLEEPCPEAVLTGIPSPSWQGAQCLRAALMSHTPGRYRFTDDLSDLGTNTTKFQLLVSDGGSVLLSAVNTAGLLVGNLRRQYWPVQRCTLRSAEALEGCIPESDGPYSSTCSAPLDWMENCENADAVCPEE